MAWYIKLHILNIIYGIGQGGIERFANTFCVRQTRGTGNMLNKVHTLKLCDIREINIVKERI